MTLKRRTLLLGGAALSCGFAFPALALDLSTLSQPSPLGEMALGPEDAKVTVVEYASASCPHCATFFKTTFQELKKQYIDTGKIRFVFREFPHNDVGLAAFMIARCAPKEKYFPLVDTFFEQQDMWLAAPRDGLFKIAQAAGFTQESFDACLKNEEIAKGIIGVRENATRNYGVESIPTFFINGQLMKDESSIEAFKAVIDPLLG